MFGSFSGIAGGNIVPSRFVKRSSSGGEAVILMCGAGEAPWGISQPSTRRMALSGWDDGFAAIAGENINVIGPGDDEAQIAVGAVDITAGAYLKSDADGRAVAASSDKDNVGAQALHDAKAGTLARVKPIRFDRAV